VNSFTLSWRNFINRPARSTLTVAGIAIAIGNFVAIIGLARGIPYAVERSINETGADFVVSERNAFMLIGASIPESLGSKIASVPDVAFVAPVLFNFISADDRINIPIVGWGKDSFLWEATKLISGRLPTSADKRAILLSDGIASILHKEVGDTVQLNYRIFTIVGIAKFESVFNQNIAVAQLATMQEVFGRPNSLSFFEVKLKRPIDAERAERARVAIANKIAADYSVQKTGALTQNLALLNLLIVAASAISFVAVVVALLGVANTMLMAINERIGEIGILRAVGWTPTRIITTIMAEGFLISAIGGLIGIGLGIIDVHVVSRLPVAYGLLDPHVTWTLLAQALGLALMVGAVGAILPARHAIAVSPAEAIRHI
jgi:putative ABC transport system permease protein